MVRLWGEVRSISTCAEVPLVCIGIESFGEVYLHVCGGTLPMLRIIAPKRGLSPRVRRYHVGS